MKGGLLKRPLGSLRAIEGVLSKGSGGVGTLSGVFEVFSDLMRAL